MWDENRLEAEALTVLAPCRCRFMRLPSRSFLAALPRERETALSVLLGRLATRLCALGLVLLAVLRGCKEMN